MPKENRDWHEQDVADELQELQEAIGFVDRWSEKSDVVYTVSRSRWSGHKFSYPLNKLDVVQGFMYMYPKYTMRFLFFRRAGKRLNKDADIRQVRNLKKDQRYLHIAQQNHLDPYKFEQICNKQYRYWRFILPR